MLTPSILLALGGLSAALAAPALADVKDGVDAWSRGDYKGAIAQWQAPAQAGDPDAMFNLGQAYRLGRGVPVDLDKAEQYYAKAADKGHIQAADIYGLMLFQRGQRQVALPYIKSAAERGDPRSEYLLGIALFYGVGLGLGPRLGLVGILAAAVLIFVLQGWASRWWLRRFRFGPAEWLWRSATYGRLQPLRGCAAAV